MLKFGEDFLNTGYTTVELVDVLHHTHSLSHERISIVIYGGEVFRARFAV